MGRRRCELRCGSAPVGTAPPVSETSAHRIKPAPCALPPLAMNFVRNSIELLLNAAHGQAREPVHGVAGATRVSTRRGVAEFTPPQLASVRSRQGPVCWHRSIGVSVQLKLPNDGGRKSIPRAPSSVSATPVPFVQPGLNVADAHSPASDRVDDLRSRFRAARVPRAATSLGVEAEQTTAERRATTVMRVSDPARGRRDRHRSSR